MIGQAAIKEKRKKIRRSQEKIERKEVALNIEESTENNEKNASVEGKLGSNRDIQGSA